MRRFTVSLSLALVVLLGLIASEIRTQAQEATPAAMTAMATHPLVGTWAIVTEVSAEETFPSVANFNADGTYTEVLPWGIVILGAWQPTGERTAVLTQIFNFLTDDDQLVQGRAGTC